MQPTQYRTRFDLECDDWLDPSLPAMYSFPLASDPFQFFDEFTADNEDFCDTTLLPAFFPLLNDGRLRLMPTPSHKTQNKAPHT